MLAFRGGGFFAGTPAALAVALLAIVLLRVTLAKRPFEGVGVGLVVATGAMLALASWAFVSAGRSESPARAILQFDLVLLYALALLVFGMWTWSTRRLRIMIWGIAGAAVVVCAAGLITRVLPDLWPIAPTSQPSV